MNAKEARAKVNAAREKAKQKQEQERAAQKRHRVWLVNRTIDEARAAVAQAVEKNSDFADINIDVIWDYPNDVNDVLAPFIADGYTVSTYEREERDWDEPGRAPDKVHVLRIEW